MGSQQQHEDISLEPYNPAPSSDVNADIASLHALSESLEADNNIESMTKTQAWNLYTTHMLTTWNARTYEFAAVSQPYTVWGR